jgi:HK97 family phage major capsid protein
MSNATKTEVAPVINVRHNRLKAFKKTEDAVRVAHWYAAQMLDNPAAKQWCQDNNVNMTMTTTSNTDGGVFVVEEMENAIVNLVETYGVFRRNARILTGNSDSKRFNRRTSGVTAYYVGENPGTDVTDSQPVFDQVQLIARTLAARVQYSQNLFEDSIINLIDFLTQEVAIAFAYQEDIAGFNGDGSSTYAGMTGLKNALLAGSKYTAITGNTAFSTLDLDDFEAMIGKVPEFPGMQPKWYIHKSGWAASMQRLAAAAGGNTTTTITSGVPMASFLGYPVEFVQVMNSTLTAQTSTTGLCYFGDLAMAATMFNRRGVTIENDKDIKRQMIDMVATERYDIVVHEVGTASTAGPMIALVTPGS